MARIRQQYPQNYVSSGNISAEFENILRYLNTAELGNKTVGELLRQLFNDAGEFSGPIEMRLDLSSGIQFRVGTYTNAEAGWVSIVPLDDLRGPAGLNVGQVEGPVFVGRADFEATSGQVDFDYAHDETEDVLVFVNGLLQTAGSSADYVADPDGGSTGNGGITFNSGLDAGDIVSAFRVRESLIAGYRRADYFTVNTQQVFAFEHEDDDRIQVYLNGLLLREGGAFDYTRQPAADTITLNTPIASGNAVSIIFAENSAARTLTGIMMEENYADPETGLIRLDRIGLPDNGVAQAKVDGLSSALSARKRLFVSSTTPSDADTGDLWLDTAITPNQLKFFDGVNWLRTAPESSLPTFSESDAGRVVRVNNTGTGLEFANVDLSSTLKVTQRGAASGVAPLDSSGRLPGQYLPQVLASNSLYRHVETPDDQEYVVQRIYRQKLRIDAIALSTTTGSCSVQVTVGGVAVGSTFTANSTGNETVLGNPIEVDAESASREIGFEVSNNASAFNLEVTLATSIMS